MVSKSYNGSAWKNINGLKLFNGSVWKNAVKGWVWNGSSWKQWYPEYPLNTSSPSVSGTATQGSSLSTTNGSWNSNLSYNPISYSYQWRRGSSDISGATSSSYSTVLADVGNAISCRVTALNNRGSTPAISSNSITVTSALPGAPTSLTLTDNTTTPTAPSSVSVSITGQTTANVSWGAGGGTISFYDGFASLGSLSSFDSGNRTASLTGGSAGASTTVSIRSANFNGIIGMSWGAGSGATSYDIYVGGSYIANTTNTSYTYTVGSTGSKSVTIYSRNASGVEATGRSASITLATKYSGYQTGSGTFQAALPTLPTPVVASEVGGPFVAFSYGSGQWYVGIYLTNYAAYDAVGGYSSVTWSSTYSIFGSGFEGSYPDFQLQAPSQSGWSIQFTASKAGYQSASTTISG